MEDNIDLLEDFENLPIEVQQILTKFFEEDNTYDTCARLVDELNEVGYTIDYGLDADPYDLRKL